MLFILQSYNVITAQATSAKSSSPEPTRVESLCSTLIYSLLYL